VPLPPLPVGTYWLDVIARDAKGTSCGWGTARVSAAGPWKLMLKTDKDVYKVGETVRLSAEVAGEIARPEVRVQVRDAAGRLLADGAARQEGKAFHFDYRVADARTAAHEALVTVRDGERPLLAERTAFYVPRFDWDDYHNILWPDGSLATYARRARDEAGITSIMDGWGRDDASLAGARWGVRPSE